MIFIPFETTSLTIGVGTLGSMLKRSGQGICSRLDKRRLDSQNFLREKTAERFVTRTRRVSERISYI